jgi:1-acyl-sn-glycerol-3-phosphate acyltransferase
MSSPSSHQPPPRYGLTPERIQRVREGLDAARDRAVRQSIQRGLENAEKIARGEREAKLSGNVRRCVLRSYIRTCFRVRVEHPENIPTTPALLAPNHLNHIDPFLILSEVPASPFYYILADARTLYNNWWKRVFLRLAKGVIPLDRLWKEEIAVLQHAKAGGEDLAELAEDIERDVPKSSSIEMLRRLDRAASAIFARGDSIMVFPEGRLGNVEGQLQLPLKRGAVIYALRSGVPIVPVALIGTNDLYFRKELTIRFGEPLTFPQSKHPKPKQVKAALDELKIALTELLPDDYREPNEIKLFRYFLNHMFW